MRTHFPSPEGLGYCIWAKAHFKFLFKSNLNQKTPLLTLRFKYLNEALTNPERNFCFLKKGTTFK